MAGTTAVFTSLPPGSVGCRCRYGWYMIRIPDGQSNTFEVGGWLANGRLIPANPECHPQQADVGRLFFLVRICFCHLNDMATRPSALSLNSKAYLSTRRAPFISAINKQSQSGLIVDGGHPLVSGPLATSSH
jgi:hypothetical protein